jgi:hypothetical protein
VFSRLMVWERSDQERVAMSGQLVDGKKRRGPKISARLELALESLCDGSSDTVPQAAAVGSLTPRAMHYALRKDHVRAWLRERVAGMLSTGQVAAAKTLLDLLKAKNSMTQLRAATHILAINGVQPADNRQPLSVSVGLQAGFVIKLEVPVGAPRPAPTIDLKANAVDDDYPVVP